MEREELAELHNIQPVTNIQSVLIRGILSYNRATRVQHASVAMDVIQQRRDKKKVPPGARTLHDYANLYINARNKMMYKLRGQHADLCVLRVDCGVLDLEGVIITDQNASSDYARFKPAPDGLDLINQEFVFAEWWAHPEDPILQMRHGSIVCAEVLVPGCVPPGFIVGAYVSCPDSQQLLRRMAPSLQIEVNRHLFFA